MSAVIAAGVLGGSLIAAPAASNAAIGGGGVGGGGAGAGAYNYLLLTYDDMSFSNPPQGWGQDSINTFKSMLDGNTVYQPLQGLDLTGHFDNYIRAACNTALSEASARGNGARSRVVQVGMTMHPGGVNGSWVPAWGGASNDFTAWYQGVADSQNNANLHGWDQQGRNLVKGAFLDNIGDQPRAVCVAVNETELIRDYPLSVSTDKGATFNLAGSKNAVNDVIHASNGNSTIRENLSATIKLHWDGPEGQRVSRSKPVTISNQGDTRTPNFVPSDFGWDSWPAGGFWFDVQVGKQGKMRAAVDTPDRDPRESWTASTIAPVKTLTHGGTTAALGDSEVLASGMFYDARIRAHTNGYTSSMTIKDTISTDKVFIGAKDRDVTSAAYVLDPSGNRVGNAAITVDRSSAGKVTVSGTVPNTALQGEYTLVVPTYVMPTKSDYTIADTSHVCYTSNQNTGCVNGNAKQTRKVTPAPDKVWVLDPNGALTESDPGHTNQEGADNMVFLPGDAVSAVVNGRIPANLAEALSTYQIIDNWTGASRYVDFSDVSKARVFFRGSDVTSQFTVQVNGSVTTATAKPEFLARTKGLGTEGAVKLVISGAFRTDYTTGGETVVLRNSGSEVWNNETVATNQPAVFTWTPDPGKQVNGSAEESGDKIHDNIDGMAVLPGQKLEYSIQLDLNLPPNTARGVKTLALEDTYDPQLIPDKSSVEFFDTRTQKPIARSAYKLSFDEANHSFKAEFTSAWIAENVNKDGANSEWENGGWLMVRFTGTVKPDTVGGSIVRNQAFQVINGVKTASEIPEVTIPSITPDKEDLDTNLNSIDGKTVLQGDHIIYRLTLDGGPSKDEMAYDVHKLGMVDDYDEEYLDLLAENITVTSKENGADVTGKFNIQIKDGTVYVFAKQVDSRNAYGDLLKGNPQPADLASYDKAPIVPHTTPIIDQGLLGQDYWITLTAVVSQEVDGYTITNQARQNTQNTNHMTRIVSNPLKAIDPEKDVVVDESSKGESLDGAEVDLYSLFDYRLNSSEIPANRAYGASSWVLSDTFDRVHDSYTGVWGIFANSDVYEGSKRIFAKGDLLANSAGHESEAYNGLFNVRFDEQSYTLTATATKKFMDIVNSRGDLAQSFSVYTKMERIAPGDSIVNRVSEQYNGVDRESNVVKTVTYEHPAIAVDKFTLADGPENGRRDTAERAEKLTREQLDAGAEVGFRIRNTGDVPLVNFTFQDTVAEGTYGTVDNVVCEVPVDGQTKAALENGSEAAADKSTWVVAEELSELALDESLDCQGTLLDMDPGMLHSGPVAVSGESVFTGTKVSDSDIWHARAPEAPGISVTKYTLEEGVEDGDRNEFKNALEISPVQASEGVKVGFRVHNTGDVPLTKVSLTDETQDGANGHIIDLVCAAGETAEGETNWIPAPEFTELAVGEAVDCQGTLIDLEPGSHYSGPASVTGESVYTGAKVSDTDMWHAKAVEGPFVEIVKYTLEEGIEAGDRDSIEDALELTPEQGAQGVKVGVQIRNGGDVPLRNVKVSNAMMEDASGKLTGLVCADPSAAEGEDAGQIPVSDITTLSVGETVNCEATLENLKPAAFYSGTASVSGESVFTGKRTESSDPWHARGLPENPAVEIVKYTLEEGVEEGDRDLPEEALELTPEQAWNGVKVGVQVRNSGDVPLRNVKITNVRMEDANGKLRDLVCVDPALESEPTVPEAEAAAVAGEPVEGEVPETVEEDSEAPAEEETSWIPAEEVIELAVGETVHCEGTLMDLKPGQLHAGTASVTGESIYTGKHVDSSDPWNAAALDENPAVVVEKYTLDEGLEKGDRDLFRNALELTPEQSKEGVKIGFRITNTGDVPLVNAALSDITRDGTTGKVNQLVCADPEQVPPESAPVAGPAAARVGDGVSAEAQARIEAKAKEAAKAAETAKPDEAKLWQPTDIDDSASTAPPATAAPFDLAVGSTVYCEGILTGVQTGTAHINLATVTADSLYSATTVESEDAWNAFIRTPAGEVPATPKVAVTGEAVSVKNPFLVGGGIAAILAALAAGAVFTIRRRRIGQVEAE